MQNRGELLGRFQQTGAPQIHIDDEDTDGKVRVWITRPGRVQDSRTGGYRGAHQSLIIGCLQRREENGWEADEQLRDYLNRIRTTPPPAEWPDLQRAITTIEGFRDLPLAAVPWGKPVGKKPERGKGKKRWTNKEHRSGRRLCTINEGFPARFLEGLRRKLH